MRAGVGGCAIAWVLLGAAACSVDVDYDDSRFQCRQSSSCPDDHDCVDHVCVLRGVTIDAGPADAGPPDAASPDAMVDASAARSELR